MFYVFMSSASLLKSFWMTDSCQSSTPCFSLWNMSSFPWLKAIIYRTCWDCSRSNSDKEIHVYMCVFIIQEKNSFVLKPWYSNFLVSWSTYTLKYHQYLPQLKFKLRKILICIYWLTLREQWWMHYIWIY